MIYLTHLIPTNIYLFKVNNRNTSKKYEICSKLTIKTLEWHRDVASDYLIILNKIKLFFSKYINLWQSESHKTFEIHVICLFPQKVALQRNRLLLRKRCLFNYDHEVSIRSGKAEVYLEPNWTSMMERFCKNSFNGF